MCKRVVFAMIFTVLFFVSCGRVNEAVRVDYSYDECTERGQEGYIYFEQNEPDCQPFELLPTPETDILASGIITENGSNLPWRLHSCGTLVVDGGFISWNGRNRVYHAISPWRDYADGIFQILFTAPIIADSYLHGLFARLWYVTTIEGLSNFDTQNVTDMGSLFRLSLRLISVDLSGWDTSAVTNMSNMFYEARGLASVDMSGWNTSAVTDMTGMFHSTWELGSVDVSEWDTGNVTYMGRMFGSASSLTSLDISEWDTGNVLRMSGMFRGTRNLTSLDLSGWNTSNVTNMRGIFEYSGITSLNLYGWDTSNVTYMGHMFRRAENLVNLNISGWDTSNVICMDSMFSGTRNLTSLDLSEWDTANVTSMCSMFSGASNLTNLDLSSWDVGSVWTMRGMFSSASSLNQLSLGNDYQFVISKWIYDEDIYGWDYPNLPEPPDCEQFSGRWQNVGVGTVENPQGEYVFTSDELTRYFDGAIHADTWVWQRR